MWAAVNGQSGAEEESVKAEPAEQEEEEQHKIWNGFEPIYTHLSFPVNDLADLEWQSTFFHRWVMARHAFSEFSMDGPKPEPKLRKRRKRVSLFSNPGLETPVLAQLRRKRTTTGGRAWSHGRGLPVLPHHPPLQAVNSRRPARPRTGTGRAGFHGKF
ncbi:hypothetical protein FH972_011232 [Carpinus fangiana]|uniref:Uncharacterized protein n=1 Tax=Carpinus fangiana TaxID=176857 RepID=A0A660KTS4_9ROSI|nr:hypothetical protein FH972_011232 [Carpinus fangiana]